MTDGCAVKQWLNWPITTETHWSTHAADTPDSISSNIPPSSCCQQPQQHSPPSTSPQHRTRSHHRWLLIDSSSRLLLSARDWTLANLQMRPEHWSTCIGLWVTLCRAHLWNVMTEILTETVINLYSEVTSTDRYTINEMIFKIIQGR